MFRFSADLMAVLIQKESIKSWMTDFITGVRDEIQSELENGYEGNIESISTICSKCHKTVDKRCKELVYYYINLHSQFFEKSF